MTQAAADIERFYADLPAFSDFKGVADPGNFHDVPDDWLVVISDIKGSTRAIEEGRYKDVNVLGVASIVAVLNCAGTVDIPYIFGGDGASFEIPPSLREAVEEALSDTRALATEAFGLELRVGIVPVRQLREAGGRLQVAKFQVSPSVTLAMFGGGGLAFAEKWVKDPQTAGRYEIQPRPGSAWRRRFSGLECRWEPIKSRKGETLSLMVQAATMERNAETYAAVIGKVREIYGGESDYRPVTQNRLRVATDSALLLPEIKVHTFRASGFFRLWYPVVLRWACALGRIIFKYGLRLGDLDGKEYMKTLVQNTDFQKFDDTLRMIIDSDRAQRERLTAYLDDQLCAGVLVYGLHIADAALMTCLVFDRRERHLHFVDGAAGGYALAAKQLKSQLKVKKAAG